MAENGLSTANEESKATDISPEAGRELYRAGKHFKASTYGKFNGFLQTNVSIIPSKYASDYEEFCKNNSAPCPLLYKSQPGQLDSPLAVGSDIRTDMAAYQAYIDGDASSDPLVDLLDHSPWDDMVTFHLGCSFSFDAKLANGGVELDSDNDMPLCLTNIDCVPAGPLKGKLVVSTRPIPCDLLDKAVQLTINMSFAHGAPIHIGNPSDIGVVVDEQGVLKGDFCGDGFIKGNEVPCFWACGFSSVIAARNSRIPLSYSQYLNSMFPTDVPTDKAEEMFNVFQYPTPTVICTDEVQQRYAMISKDALEKLNSIGKNANVTDSLEFSKVCVELSMRGRSVGIQVGSLQGIAGAIYLARALQALGAEAVILIVGDVGTLEKLSATCKIEGFAHRNIAFLPPGEENERIFNLSHMIAIDSFSHGDVTTISIRTTEDRDFLVTSGNLNSACFALAAGLYTVRKCAVHDRYQRRGLGFPQCYCSDDFIVSPEMEVKIHTLISELGFADDEINSPLIAKLRKTLA